MFIKLHNIITYFQLHPRKIFLMDAIGAFITAFTAYFIIAKNELLFGLPGYVFQKLALLASGFAIYSIVCYLLNLKKWNLFLQLIAFANTVYGFITIGLLMTFYNEITIFSWIYFPLEILVIALIVYIEYKVSLSEN